MKYSCLGIILFLSAPVWAQLPDLKEGIYNSFYSFQHNRPLPIKVLFNLANEPEEKSAERIYVTSNQIMLDTQIKIKKKKYQKRNMWGFYNGKDVYISSKAYAETNIIRYSRILGWGRYAYFVGAQDLNHTSAFIIGGLLGTVPIKDYMVLDMQNGQIVKLTSQFIENILAQYPERLKQFQQEKNNEAILLKYLQLYNQLYLNANSR